MDTITNTCTVWKVSVLRVFLSVFSRIRTAYSFISLYSVHMRKNTAQKNSEYGHFSHSDVGYNSDFDTL